MLLAVKLPLIPSGVMLAVVATEVRVKLPASAPVRLKPVPVTALFWPTFLSAKLALPPLRLTASPTIAPWRARPVIVALLVPS